MAKLSIGESEMEKEEKLRLFAPTYTEDHFRRDALQWHVTEIARTLKKKFPDIKTIAFSGMSGACVAFPLMLRHGFNLIFVSKECENRHGYPVEGYFGDDYVVVDDGIASGETVNRIIRRICQARHDRGIKREMPKAIVVYSISYQFQVDAKWFYYKSNSHANGEKVFTIPVINVHASKIE